MKFSITINLFVIILISYSPLTTLAQDHTSYQKAKSNWHEWWKCSSDHDCSIISYDCYGRCSVNKKAAKEEINAIWKILGDPTVLDCADPCQLDSDDKSLCKHATKAISAKCVDSKCQPECPFE